MESISPAGEEPPDNQNEGEHSDEACQFMAEPPGGSQSGHQRKSGFMKKFRRSLQRCGNPSLTRQSSVKGKARQSFESCTSYCQRLVSFLASMVTWAQLKTIVILIQLLTFARTTFHYCKVLVTWAQLKTIVILIQLLTFARTKFHYCKALVIWAQLKTLAISFSLMRFVKTMFRLIKVIMKLCFTSYDIVSDFLQGK